jgi:hypothetical protein
MFILVGLVMAGGRPAKHTAFDNFTSTLDDIPDFHKFSSRGSNTPTSRNSVLKHLCPILDKLSGSSGDDDKAALISAYLCKNKGVRNILAKELGAGEVSEARSLKRKLGEAFRNSAGFDKDTFVQFVCDKPWATLKNPDGEYRFTGLGQSLLRSVRKIVQADGFAYGQVDRDMAGKNKGGRPRIAADPAKRAKLDKLYDENTEIASKRIGQVVNIDAPHRTLTAPPHVIGAIAKNAGICCRKAFVADFRSREDVFYSTRLTDYCKYCNKYRLHLLFAPRLFRWP